MKIQRALVFAGAGTQNNILSGTNLQYAPFDGSLKIGATISASTGTLNAFAGADQFIDQAYLPPVNRVPLLPEDYMVLDEVEILAGEQIKIDVTLAGAATLIYTVELTPLDDM